MNENEFENLKEARWRRKLTASEQAALQKYLAAHAESQPLWEEEARFSQWLEALPDTPVSTNFVSRVLQAVERDAPKPEQRKHAIFDWLRLNWLPRIAIASLVIATGFLSVQHFEKNARLEQIAQGMASLSTATAVPQEWLQDFEAISRLSPPAVDDELLLALQ